MGNAQSGAKADITVNHKPSGGLSLNGDQLDLVDGDTVLVELNLVRPGFTDGIEDTVNHRITPAVAGLYLIEGSITLKNCVADKKYRGLISKNGAGFANRYVQSSILDFLTIPLSALKWLSDSEYIDMRVTSYAGENTVDVNGSTAYTWLELTRIR